MSDQLSSVVVRIPAKINISLGVGPLRPDGFHELRTVFHAVGLYDVITVVAAPELGLRVTGPESSGLAADSHNLAWRAAVLLASHVGREPAVGVTVEKHIPVAAGLAGGSADAAAVLIALDRLWGLRLPVAELYALAARLGSDVAFTLAGGTAVGTGRGEHLQPLPQANLHWVLAIADAELSTAAAYAGLDAQRASGTSAVPVDNLSEVIAALSHPRQADPRLLARALGNDLQPVAIAAMPALRDCLRAGLERGAIGGVVSGSGPTVAFLIAGSPQAAALAADLNGSGHCRNAVAVAGGVHPEVTVASFPTLDSMASR